MGQSRPAWWRHSTYNDFANDAVALRRPGGITRPPGWWDTARSFFSDTDPVLAAVHAGPSGDDGFAVAVPVGGGPHGDDGFVRALRVVDLHAAGCELITITQYLRPSLRHHPVERWVKPEEFVELAAEAEEIGFSGVMSGPLVRSSYRAGRLYRQAVDARQGAPA